MSSRAPNIAHTTIAAAQEAGQIHSIITQNVDGLHQKAGSHNVLDLHGNLHSVKCMSCGQTSSRQVLQEMLRDCNSLLLEETVAAAAAAAAADAGMQRPDGDAALESIPDGSFSFPSCAACKDGILKPDVVFFGDNLPIERREESFRLVDEADMLLVAGAPNRATAQPSARVHGSFVLCRGVYFMRLPPPPVWTAASLDFPCIPCGAVPFFASLFTVDLHPE